MKNYQSFLSEQKEFIYEKKAANLSATGVVGLGDQHSDTVFHDAGKANIFRHGEQQTHDWAQYLAANQLHGFSKTYNLQQYLAILNGMSVEKRRQMKFHIDSSMNFKNKANMEAIQAILSAEQINNDRGTFTPGPYGKWGI